MSSSTLTSSRTISDRARSFRSAPDRGGGVGRARRYLLRLGAIVAAALCLTATLVWTVDPYGALGHNRVGIYAESERQAKPAMMRALPAAPDTVLIGTSKAAYIDPSALGAHAFNASFAAAMPEEIVNFLRNHVPPGTRVIIALDSFMMNAQAYPLSPDTFAAAPSRFDTMTYLLGLRPTIAAVAAAVSHAIGEPPLLTPRGQRDPATSLARHAAMAAPDHEKWLEYLRANQYAHFDYSRERVEALRAIRTVAEERGLTLHVFIDPLSAPVRAMIAGLPAAREVARFHSDVTALLPGSVDMNAVEGFDDPDLYFRFDPFHYLPSTGTRILQAVLAHPPVYRPPAVPKPFGVVRGDDYSPGRLGLTLKRNEVAPQDSSDEAVQ